MTNHEPPTPQRKTSKQMASREVVSLLHPPQRSPHHSGGISTKWHHHQQQQHQQEWPLNYDSGRSYQPLPPSSAPSGRTIEVIGAFPSLVHLHKAWSSYQSWIDVNQDVRSQEFCDLQQKLDQQVAALASSPLKDKSKSKFPLPSTTEATLPQPPLHPMMNKLLPSGEKKQPHDLSEFRATAMVGSHVVIHEGERNLEGLSPINNSEAEWKRRGSLITSQQRSPEGAGNDAAVVLGDNDYGSRFTTIEDKKRLYQQQQRISSKHYTPTTTIYPTPTPTTIVATAATATTPSRIPPSHEKQQNYHCTNFKQNHAGSTRRRENSYNLQSGGGGGGIYCGNLYSQHSQHLGQQQRHQEWYQPDFASKPNQQSIRRGRPSPPPPPPPQSRFHHHAVQFQQNNAQIAPDINNRRDRSTISTGSNSNWFRHGNPERNPREVTKGPSLVDVEGKYQAMRQDGTSYPWLPDNTVHRGFY